MRCVYRWAYYLALLTVAAILVSIALVLGFRESPFLSTFVCLVALALTTDVLSKIVRLG